MESVSPTALEDYPMLPLSTPMLPATGSVLRLFEPRYLEMFDRQRDRISVGEKFEFGVAMISRGSEAGGGDVRTTIGCRVIAADLTVRDDGQVDMLAFGVERIRVIRWLEDAPFPRAEVERWPDLPGPSLSEPQRKSLLSAASSVTTLAAELEGSEVPALPVFDWEGERAMFQIAGWAGLGPLDRFGVLAAPSRDERAAALSKALEDQLAVLKFRQTC